MNAFDRLDYLATRDERASARPSGPTVGQVLDRRDVVVFRVRTGHDRRGVRWHELRAYTAAFDVIEFDYADARADDQIRLALLRLLFEQYPHINWHIGHDVYVLTGEIRRSPDDNETGWLPDEDQTFGGSPAVYVADHAPALATTGA